MNKSALRLNIKNAICSFCVPAGIYLIMEIISRVFTGAGVINNMADMKNLARTFASLFCIALALSCNLPAGRMDFSLGSQMILAVIFGGNIALRLGMGGIGTLVLSIIFGLIAGFLVGVAFVKTRIIPMILGMGMALIYECISFSAFNSKGLQTFGNSKLSVLSNVTFISIVVLLVTLVMGYLFLMSPFGYNRKAIQGNQRIAMNSGINIFTNCVICYTLAGGLVAIAGIFDTVFKGNLAPVLGMDSRATVMGNMFAVMLGMTLARFSNSVVGILMAVLSIKILTLGLSKLALDNSIQTIIIYFLFLVLMIYRMNESEIKAWKKKKLRIAEAKRIRAKMAG